MDDPRVKTLSEIFVHTLSTNPDVIRQAEAQLQLHSSQPGFGIALLKLIATDLPEEHRLAPAVNFKNFVKAHWAPKADPTRCLISDAEKDQIKALLTTLMLSAPPRVRAQLGEALVIIGMHDYPARWPTLLPELLEKLQIGDPSITNGVLETANSIYKRYRNQVMTEALSKELEYSQVIIKPLLQSLATSKAQLAEAQSASNVEAMKVLLSNIRLICRIFYSLNSPGLTEAMEETLDAWMKDFHELLMLNIPQLKDPNEERESILDAVKGAICDNLVLFMELNEEEFAKYVDTFTNDVWNQLSTVTDRPGQDHLAMSAMHFLTGVAKSTHHNLFKGPALEQVCHGVIVPNIRIRDDLEETFEVNYMEYIQRDTEGSDSDTRRRAATELVKALTKKFPVEVTQLFLGYVNAMLQEYRVNPIGNWKSKDCAIYLAAALTVHGKTMEKGATVTNEFVDIPQFFRSDIQPELAKGSVNELPIVKADALKFVSTFRSQIPKQDILVLLPHMVQMLTSESNVVHSYAATTMEQLLNMKVHGVHVFSPEEVQPVLLPLLTNLFAAFSKPESEENPYLMKCVMRVIVFTGPQISGVAAICLQELARLLLQVAGNPKQPQFAYYMFESIAAILKHCPITEAEERLFPAFNILLQQDVQEFHPYVFQILSQFIDARQPPLPPVYLEIFPPLLTQFYWARKGNIPALVRLLQSYLLKAGPDIVQKGHLQSLLGVFQKLVSTKAHDHEGFYILNALMESLPLDVISPFLPTLWGLLFDRLQNSRTPKFVRSFIVFLALFMCKHGVVLVASSVDAVQAGLFVGGILQQVWLPHFATVSGKYELKLVAIATTKVIFEYPPLQQPQTAALWGHLLHQLLSYLDSGAQPDEQSAQADEDLPETGYTAGYARLVNSGREAPDPLPGKDPREELTKSLIQLYQAQPGTLVSLLQAGNLSPDVRQRLQAYCPTVPIPAC